MSITEPLVESEIRKLAIDWYSKLSDHAPLEEYITLLAENDLQMQFPETTIYGFKSFKDWYQGVVNKYFNQIHTLKELKVIPEDDHAKVQIIVHWQASFWEPPAAQSKRVELDAYQRWVVKRSPTSHKPLIVNYIVDRFEYAEGSAKVEDRTEHEISMNTRQVIEQYYETVNVGDWNTWLTLFDDHIVIDEQLAGHIEGIESLRQGVDGLQKGYSKFQNIPKHIVVDGNQACAVSRIQAANASGVPIEANVANYFRLDNGRIVYFQNFHDTRPFDPFVKQKLT
ncbi:nuclear transport factor 2 family protein [Nostoc punctiforme UO1]|uniref:nuclear transport factor 2 family protein n=1 Tax=Nostoc punctiforme TaxID=272131 RepID=UPI00309F7E7E